MQADQLTSNEERPAIDVPKSVEVISSKSEKQEEGFGRWIRQHRLTIALSIIVLLGIIVAVPIGVCLGVPSDDCDDEMYQVTLEIRKELPPEIETSNSSTIVLGPGDKTSQTWNIHAQDRGYHLTFSQFGWVNKGLRVEYVDEFYDTMTVKVIFHNEMWANDVMTPLILPADAMTAPVCEPDFTSETFYHVTNGSESEEVQLGRCRLSRLDDESLQPREIEVAFHGKIYVEKDPEWWRN